MSVAFPGDSCFQERTTRVDDVTLTAMVTSDAAGTVAFDGASAGGVGGTLSAPAVLTTTTGADPAPIAGEQVTFDLGNFPCTASTNDEGTASCDLAVTEVAQAGELTATFAGTTEYAASSGTADVTIDPAAAYLAHQGSADATADVPLVVGAQLSMAAPGMQAFSAQSPGVAVFALAAAAGPAARTSPRRR